MKKQILFIFLYTFTFLNIDSFAQSNWTASNTGLPSNPYVNDFALASNGDIYILVNSNAQGYLYKSSNNGSSWVNVTTNGLPTGGWANSLFIKNNSIFIGTGNLGAGLYTSTDNGQNWTASNTGLPSNPYVNDFALASNGDIYILVNSNAQGYLYKSSNNGSSWVNITTNGLPTGGWANSLFIKNNSIFIGTGNLGAGLYTSTDNGQNWTASNTGLPTNPYVNDFAPAGNGDIYILVNSNSQGYLYKSSNNGSSWVNVTTNGLPTGGWANSLLIKNNSMFIGTGNLGAGLYISSFSNGINEVENENSISIFPNPTNGNLYVLSEEKIDEIIITNSFGQIIYKAKPNEKNLSLHFDRTGIYFFTLTLDKKIITQRLIVCD